MDASLGKLQTVPYGQQMPMCGMNLAFDTRLLPAMYFWPQIKYRRFGDIWAGLVAKKTLDVLGKAATVGSPNVYHSRLSDRKTNLIEEAKGNDTNDYLWGALKVFCPSLGFPTPEEAVLNIADFLTTTKVEEFGENLKSWVKAVEKVRGE